MSNEPQGGAGAERRYRGPATSDPRDFEGTPDGIKVFGCLRGELEGRTHPRVFKRAARR